MLSYTLNDSSTPALGAGSRAVTHPVDARSPLSAGRIPDRRVGFSHMGDFQA